jgi:D-beta-D-heptose 7-phosphate kinase/D-beta-D-heptose 1-phosphate adenosyltransferase
MLPSAYEWTPAGQRPLRDLLDTLDQQRAAGRRVVTTNGCFDLLHIGHVRFLNDARALGDLLVVGLNSDGAVRRLKGPGRPVVAEADRAAMLAALRPVDHVVVFDNLLPNDLLAAVRPALHCKAGDYTIESLPEAEVVRSYGGEVCILPLTAGHSTSQLIERISRAGQEQAALTATASRARSAPALERLLDGANVLRQTAYRLHNDLARAASLIARVLAQGQHVIGHGDESSAPQARRFAAALHDRARLARGTHSSGTANFPGAETITGGQPGDILLLLGQASDAPDLPAAIVAARARGMAIIALTGAHSTPPLDTAEMWLRVPSDDQLITGLAQVAVLGALGELVVQLLAEGHRHD